jgi:membrane-bound lytic murein transglycosylase D
LTSLGVVARATASGVDEIRDLNPHFLRGATPREWRGFVRVPVGRAAGFDSIWAAMPESERVSFTSVTTRKGQTFAAIAAAHGIDARRLAWYNPGLNIRRRLPAGRSIVVPASHVFASARDVPDPSIERYGSAQASPRGGRVVHVVRRGESLGLIARRYRTSVVALRRANGLKRTVVYPGQSIIVRTGAGGSTGGATVSSRGTAKRSTAKARAGTKRKATTSKASTKRKLTPKKGTTAKRRPS